MRWETGTGLRPRDTVRQDVQDRTGSHPHQPRRQSRNPQQTEQSRTDRRGGTALLTGGLLACPPEPWRRWVRIQPEEPIFSISGNRAHGSLVDPHAVLVSATTAELFRSLQATPAFLQFVTKGDRHRTVRTLRVKRGHQHVAVPAQSRTIRPKLECVSNGLPSATYVA